MLYSQITQDELSTAFKLMVNNKPYGPDGLPAEFYKHFWSIIAPIFYQMISERKQDLQEI